MTWDDEVAAIKEMAQRRGVDWAFVAAIRKAENGGDGRQFGVLSVEAATYEDQLMVCCNSVAHRLDEYPANPVGRRDGRLVYREGFIDYFARHWAPIGADNDPSGLNANWTNNVEAFYAQFANEG